MFDVVEILLLEKMTFLTEVKAQWKATILMEPKEPLSVNLFVDFNPKEKRKAQQKQHPQPEWGGCHTLSKMQKVT